MYNMHGLRNNPLYPVWNMMKQRCMNPNCKAYKYYGGRGIHVCKLWTDNFKNFYDWSMENGWEPGLSIDRIDNDGNYEPSNCRWVDKNIQANNTSANRYITFNGETHTEAEWAKKLGMNKYTLSSRINLRHWSIEKAFTTPVKVKK